MYSRWRFSYQEVWVGILLAGLAPPHLGSYPIPGPGFPKSYVVFLFVFCELNCEVIVRFVEVGIVDHRSFNFLFIKLYEFWLDL